MKKDQIYTFNDMPLQPKWLVEVDYQLEDGSFDHAHGVRKETFIAVENIRIFDSKFNDITNRIRTKHYKQYQQLECHLDKQIEDMCSSEFE